MYRIQKKKKKGFLFYLVLFISAFAVGLGIGYATIKIDAEKQKAELKQQEEILPAAPTSAPADKPASLNLIVPEETPEPEPMYFVVAQNDSVAVFTFDEQGDKRFSYKLAIDLDDLPLIDQKLFSEGIYLYSKQELFELTEDFSS